MTQDKINKIELAYSLGCSNQEVCLFAGISLNELDNFLKDDAIRERMELLKTKPVLKARQTVIKDLDNVETAKWYLKNKKSDEFSERNELTGADGKDLIPSKEEVDKLEQILDIWN